MVPGVYTLPVSDRILIYGFALIILVALGYAGFRLGVRQVMLAHANAIVPRAGVMAGIPASTDAALIADFKAWESPAYQVLDRDLPDDPADADDDDDDDGDDDDTTSATASALAHLGIIRGSDFDLAVDAWILGSATVPAPALATSATQAATTQALQALLARGLHFGSNQYQEPGREGLTWMYGVDAMDSCAQRLAIMARENRNPAPALSELDAIFAAKSPPDCICALAELDDIDEDRDKAYLGTVIAGTLAQPDERKWQEDPCKAVPLLVSLMELDRLSLVEEYRLYAQRIPVFHWQRDLPSAFSAMCSDWEEFQTETSWLDGEEKELGNLEDRLLQGHPDLREKFSSWAGDPTVYTLERATGHRLAVLAAQVVDRWRDQRTLPADAGTLDLGATACGPALIYHRFNDHRFAITVASADDPPDWDMIASASSTLTGKLVLVELPGSR
jgi:hypothetical protein